MTNCLMGRPLSFDIIKVVVTVTCTLTFYVRWDKLGDT